MLEDPYFEDSRIERCYIRRVIGWVLLLIGFVVAGIAVSVHAAPRANSAEECALAADMALVARSLAAEKIDRPTADRVLRLVYTIHSPVGEELLKAITDTAYRPTAPDPADYARMLMQACMRSGGDMDGVLGVGA